tara:strand:- start:5796 stop:6389 length:594 start_codon:yes stop_codon:yes gene_type:complete
MKFEDFIYVNDNALPEDLCDQIIIKYEEDDRKSPGLVGITGDDRVVDTSIKTSVDLFISDLDDWKDVDSTLAKVVSQNIQNYINHSFGYLGQLNPTPNPFRSSSFEDRGYNIKAYEPGGYFHWHDDFALEEHSPRMLAMLFYLNTIDEGGYTEFVSGARVYPVTGRLVMFPATWNYIHRGVPPKKDKKYIMSAYLYQ